MNKKLILTTTLLTLGLASFVMADNPTPTISFTSPNSVMAGSSAFTLNVTGSNFVPGSVVSFNGIPRATAYISPTMLTAVIPAFDVAMSGTSMVSVFNPTPAGGISNYTAFTIAGSTVTPTLPNTGVGPENPGIGFTAGLLIVLSGMSLTGIAVLRKAFAKR